MFDQPIHRRGLLQIGSVGALGLSLPSLLAGRLQANEAFAEKPQRESKAKSCLLFFLEGGPAHQDLWDMKPDAPSEYGHEFKPIASTLDGVPVCDQLPMLARQMHHMAMVRSVHHTVNDHNAGAYYMLTGRSPVKGGSLIVRDEPENFPPFGAVMAMKHPHGRIPEFVHLPDVMSNMGYDIPGQRAGFLGASYDPLVAGDPSAKKYRIPGLKFPKGGSRERLNARRSLLETLDRNQDQTAEAFSNLGTHYEKAFTLLASNDTRNAFNLSDEPESLRIRYGMPDRDDRSVEARKFGGLPHLGQCMLTARRLIESGVRLVTVCTGRRIDQTWDTHRQHYPLLKRSILPYVDRAFSALLEDMSDRGLLDETLVIAMGEFGRTPKLGQVTSGAGATPVGRDHWPYCYSMMMAGAGVQAGALYGKSDRYAAYPAEKPCTPEDIAATIYHALGLEPESRIYDPLNRPHSLALGDPILDILT